MIESSVFRKVRHRAGLRHVYMIASNLQAGGDNVIELPYDRDFTIECNMKDPVKVAVSHKEAPAISLNRIRNSGYNIDKKITGRRMGYVVSADICDNCIAVRTIDAVNAIDLASWEERIVDQCYER